MKFLNKFYASLMVMVFCITFASASYAEIRFTVMDPYALETIGNAKAGAIFMSIHNGWEDDKLIGVEVSQDIAEKAELHTHSHDNGVMRMRQVSEIKLPSRKKTELKPSGDHIMLMGLKKPLKAGEVIDFKLVFEKSGKMPSRAEIRSVSGDKHGNHNHGHHHHGH